MCLKGVHLYIGKNNFGMIHKKLLTMITPRKCESVELRKKKKQVFFISSTSALFSYF